jgi:hypothetical protein
MFLLVVFAGAMFVDIQMASAAGANAVAPQGREDVEMFGYAVKIGDFFTALSAIAAIALSLYAVKQAHDMRQSLEIAKHQLKAANDQRSKDLGDQLFEFDKLLIAHPELQIELEALRTSGQKFRDSVKDQNFVRLKSFIYMHLNFFDEIISTYGERSVPNVEIADWHTYIIEKMAHPAYRDVMHSEGEIFGKHLRQFMTKHEEAIKKNGDGEPWK